MTAVFWSSFGALWLIVAFQSLVILGLTRTVHVRGVLNRSQRPACSSTADRHPTSALWISQGKRSA